MKKILAPMLLLLASGSAFAQVQIDAPPETIYSDAQRAIDLDHSRRVVETLLAPSFSVDDQYARWKRPVCPRVYGLTPVAAWQLEHRIKEIAHQVGAGPELREQLTDAPRTLARQLPHLHECINEQPERALGGHTPGRGVRLGQVASVLELLQLVADGGR